jgi:hypothetical protein
MGNRNVSLKRDLNTVESEQARTHAPRRPHIPGTVGRFQAVQPPRRGLNSNGRWP